MHAYRKKNSFKSDKDAEATIVVLQEKVEQLESSNKQLQVKLLL